MEDLLVISFFAGILVVAYATRLKRSERRPPEAPARQEQPLKPLRFDEKTARPLPAPVCISGPAYVIDGDSIVIRNTQIRLFGIDAPELNHPFGKKAKWALVALCKGQTVRAEIAEEDHFGRTVARCFLPDGRDLSAEMVTCGLALDWPKFSGGKYRGWRRPTRGRSFGLPTHGRMGACTSGNNSRHRKRPETRAADRRDRR